MASTGKQEELFPAIGDQVAEGDAAEGGKQPEQAEAAEGAAEGKAAEGEAEEGLENGPTVIQDTLCMACGGTGTTNLLLTQIPNFRELVIMAFECEDEECGFRSSEVNFSGELQTHGVRLQLQVTSAEDLNRQLIKSDTASVIIPEVQFEIPPKTQRGSINTIEGIITNSVRDLRENQDERREIDPETTARIGDVLTALTMMAHGITLPFTIIVDDPAGNSFIENPLAPAADPQMEVSHYVRTPEQDIMIGLQPTEQERATGHLATGPRAVEPPRNEGLDALVAGSAAEGLGRKEIVRLPAECFNCQTAGEMLMCSTDIPHFREVLIYAFNCEQCGFRSNEIKGGGAISSYGEKLTLRVAGDNPRDMTRDVLKSDSAGIEIPELDLWMEPGSLGGLYTTVEGLISHLGQSIQRANPLAVGDSTTEHHGDMENRLQDFLARLDGLKEGTTPFTLILTDPLANSFVTSYYEDPAEDPTLTIEQYTRSEEEDDNLGITDMVTTNYEHLAPLAGVSESGDDGEGDEGEEAKGGEGKAAEEQEQKEETILPDRLTYVNPTQDRMRRCRNCNGVGVDLVKDASGYCDRCMHVLGIEPQSAPRATAGGEGVLAPDSE